MSLAAGSHLGPYEIVSPLGVGGMGEVYRARDARLQRDVAIKVLPPQVASDPDRLARFAREAQVLASLNHPHIAQVYGIEEAGGVRGLVMELVDGPTLAARLVSGALPMDEALVIAQQIADALDAAHERGIVHRDLKPANIKLTADGTVKVLDFGLAKALDQRSGTGDEGSGHLANSPTITTPAMTEAGIILGTAAYMSPEQARGKAVDKRADIWAFGCVLYEMLTGTQAFVGETVTDLLAAVVKNDPDWGALPAETPARIRTLLARCLQKDPKARLRDIGDARLEIVDRDAIDRGAPSAARRPAPLWLALTAAVALAIGGAGGGLWRNATAPPSPRWSGARLGGPSTVLYPALAPDGQLLAFQTIVDGQSQIAVMKPGGGTWQVLTHDRTRGATVAHDWSPDGSRIFYDRQTDTLNGIYAVPALGGDERLVLENAGYPSALPDGGLLVIRINASRQPQLHRFSPSSGQVDPLPALPDSAANDDLVLPSRDGRRAYFYGRPMADADAASGFYEIDLESPQVRPLAGNLRLRPPVAMAAQRGTDGIVLGGLDGDVFRLLRVSPSTDAEPLPLLMVPAMSQFDIGEDGSIYLTFRSRPVELFTLQIGSASTGHPERLPTSPVMAIRGVQSIAPLPDGSVLVGSRGGDRDRVLVVRAGKQPIALVDGDDETRPPMTPVGDRHAAMMMGAASAPDIAIVGTADGRIVRRFKASASTMTSMAASPDGTTLYYAAGGFIWAMSADGGTPRQVGAGDSVTVEPETGDLIVKLDEGERIRLVRMKGGGGVAEPIPVHGDLRLIPRPLMPGAARQGRLALAVASSDSWFWHAAVLDLKTGAVTKVREENPSDFHLLAWGADGRVIGLGFGLDTALWRFTPRPN